MRAPAVAEVQAEPGVDQWFHWPEILMTVRPAPAEAASPPAVAGTSVSQAAVQAVGPFVQAVPGLA